MRQLAWELLESGHHSTPPHWRQKLRHHEQEEVTVVEKV
jgi:hypothetical protein